MTFTAVAPVERVLELAASGSPGATAAAAVALREALAGIRTSSWPEVAWPFSRITGDGYPVEFTFSSHDGALRYTTEVGGPEMGHAAVLRALGQPTPGRLRVIAQAFRHGLSVEDIHAA